MTLLLSIIVGILIAVLFDAILHGISHSGHELLSLIWTGEENERNTETWLINSIQWHIVADTIIGFTLGFLMYIINENSEISPFENIIIGILIGLLSSSYYFHIYAAYQVQRKSSFGLSLLSFLQTNIIIHILFLINT